MISAEQNELMTRSGPGTPGGRLLRNYWQPVALVDELEGKRPVKAVKVLGQDLVLFRDESGRYGLLDRDCPHRGADLAYGTHRGWRAALRIPRLALRRARPVPADTGRTRRQQALPAHKTEVLSRGREERDAVRMVGRCLGRNCARRIPRLRLLRRARLAHLRVQGFSRMQLAAGARGRHRSGARLVPASLLRGRGHLRGLWQAVPRHLCGLRTCRSRKCCANSTGRKFRSSARTTACASSHCARSARPTRTCA